MDIEGGSAGGSQSGGGDDTSGWQTGPMGEDGGDGFIGAWSRQRSFAAGGREGAVAPTAQRCLARLWTWCAGANFCWSSPVCLPLAARAMMP